MAAPQAPKVEFVHVGSDLVEIAAGHVVIHARRPHHGWQARDFVPAPVFFRGTKYRVRATAAGQAPFAARYLLVPWPPELQGSLVDSFTYDEQTVAERDAERRSERGCAIGRVILLLVYPFLGLLWSNTQFKLVPFGFVPRIMTVTSVFTTFAALLLQSIFTLTSVWAGQGTRWHFIGLLVLLVDCMMRYHCHLSDPDQPCGFLEWLKRILPRNGHRIASSDLAGTSAPADSPWSHRET